jgi:hypothetical protein
MRDIVSEVGTFFTGLSALPVIKTTQTSPAVKLAGYDGAQIYILAGNYTDGTITPVIQYTNDDGTGNPNSGGWTSVPTSDLVAWSATSTTDSTPKKLGNQQPNAISSSATAINQRIGYIGGVAGTSDYIRVVSTVTGSPATGSGFDVIIHLGRPRTMPASV